MTERKDQNIIRPDRLDIIMRRTGLFAGPVLFALIYFLLHPASMNEASVAVFAMTVWISAWWITEAVPLPATSLLPIVFFPLLDIAPIRTVTSSYGDPLIFLFAGGFLLAIAVEKTGLHYRIALSIIRRMGSRLHMIVLGFMLATACISMWISNTATAIMMLPIGLSVIAVASQDDGTHTIRFGKALMLAIAYAASIGGVGTLIGTAPNLIFAGIVEEMLGIEITFLQWLMIGFPLVVVMLLFSWWYLTHVGYPLGKSTLPGGIGEIHAKYNEMGPMTTSQKRVAILFAIMALAWITRSFLLNTFIPRIDDTIIAIAGGLALFIVSSGRPGRGAILTWDDAPKLPWGILLLFGGGLAIAGAFETTGLAGWIADRMSGLAVLGTFLILLLVVLTVNVLTEFTSNTACVSMILPVLGPVAASAGLHPLVLMTGATMIASYGFMMPAGTPPNAIAFGSGFLRIRDMIRTGLVLNIVSVVLISLLVYFFVEKLWGI